MCFSEPATQYNWTLLFSREFWKDKIKINPWSSLGEVTLNCVLELDNSYSWYIVTFGSKRKRQCKTQYVFNDQKTNSNLLLRTLHTAINSYFCPRNEWGMQVSSVGTQNAFITYTRCSLGHVVRSFRWVWSWMHTAFGSTHSCLQISTLFGTLGT